MKEPTDREYELYDGAVQTLYGVGLTLQALVPLVQQPQLQRALEGAVSDIDAVVTSLRSHLGQRRCAIPVNDPPAPRPAACAFEPDQQGPNHLAEQIGVGTGAGVSIAELLQDLA